ncbi:MAG: DUF4065 domain-containing protein [Candidatus Goldbacteria bacterium]|nr:DUF4065 domain-containing protein [Candidatus Goldiibacteriota bacterium]
MKKVLCPECGKLTVPKIITAEREVIIRGEKITVISDMPKCTCCGSELLMKSEGRDSYTLAYDIYRKKHNLLTAEEIITIRKKYELSPKPFSLLLGWGELTIYKYEKGALQDDAHDEVLKFVNDPENMKMIYDDKLKDNLAEADRGEFEKTLDRLLGQINPYEKIIQLKFRYKPDEFSGNRPFSIEKAANLILKIIKCSVKKSLFEVQLVKCLFYSDFLNFKNSGISMTGLRYAHGPYGPVVDEYHDLFDYMAAKKMVNMQVIPFETGEGHQYTNLSEPDESVFSESEKKLVDEICVKLTPLSSKQLSEKTHKEVQGWKDTASGQYITYRYAERIENI